MDLDGIMLSEISQREKEKHCMFSLICGIKKTKQKNTTKQSHTHRYKEQTGSCQRVEVSDKGERDEEVQTSSYKMNTSQGCNVHYGEYSQYYCNNFVWRQVVPGLDPFGMHKNVQIICCTIESNIIL